MPPNEDLSPEEKLLRVIQGNPPPGGQESGASAVPDAPEETVSVENAAPVNAGVADVGTVAEESEKASEPESQEDVSLPEIKLPEDEPLSVETPQEDVSVPIEVATEDAGLAAVEEENPQEAQPEEGREGEEDIPEPTEDEERPKLQLVRQAEPEPENVDDLLDVPVEDETHSDVEAGTDDLLTESEEGEDVGTAVVVPLAVVKKRKDDEAGIRKMNRLLMVAAILVVVLIGFQIWASVREKTVPAPLPGDILLPDDVEMADLPPIEDIQKLFSEKPWFIDTSTTIRTNGVEKPDNFERFVRENIKLVGVSEISDGKWESIIVDKKIDKMHFLQVGDRMLTGSQGNKKELSVLKISSDGATVSDGRKEYELTGR